MLLWRKKRIKSHLGIDYEDSKNDVTERRKKQRLQIVSVFIQNFTICNLEASDIMFQSK